MTVDLKSIQVGKLGVTEGLISEVKTILGKHKKVKVKILKSALKMIGRKKIIDVVSTKSNAKVVDARGNTFILEKR